MPRREIGSVDDKAEENRKFEDLFGGNSLLIGRNEGRINLQE